MNRYKLISQYSNVIGYTSGAVLGKISSDLASKFTSSEIVSIIAILAAFAICAKFLPFILDYIFDHVSLLRRILLGKTFIEGRWVEIVYKNGVPIGFAVVSLDSAEYNIIFEGTIYSLDASLLGTFRGESVNMTWPVVYCKHSSKLIDSVINLEGHGELQFAIRRGIPTRYDGSFSHNGSADQYHSVATKIEKKSELIRLNDALEEIEFIKEY